MTPYYDVGLKEDRIRLLERLGAFRLHRCMLEDSAGLAKAIEAAALDVVVHLAAQAGVRYSLEHPRPYIDSNVGGSFNLLELCKEFRPRHVLIASTSSVYGVTTSFPTTETADSDHPLTIYAAAKKSVEGIAHCYSHLWELPVTVFRLFSAYGPWGRPDMALFKFVKAILEGQPIDVYNHGRMERDFTYVDDAVEAIVRLAGNIPQQAKGASVPTASYRLVNIGGGRPVQLLDLIAEIERVLGKPARRNYMEMQLGDVDRTEASTALLEKLTGYRPNTPISVGVEEFVRWYRGYYCA